MSTCCDFCGVSILSAGTHMISGIDRSGFTAHICLGCAKIAVKHLMTAKPDEEIHHPEKMQANMGNYQSLNM